MPFRNPAGLFALLAVIPLILLYMRRPRPKERTIPSLMFFMKDAGVTRFSTLFRQIVKNLIFLLQFGAILAAAFAVASPFFESENAALATHTVIVIDSSASMGALIKGAGDTRVDKAVDMAAGQLQGGISIVLAENIPVVVLEKGTAGEARKVLSALRPRATDTHLGDAITAAGELIGDKAAKSRVVVVSDFQANQGTDVIVAKRALSARGIVIDLVSVLGPDKSAVSGLSNVGFVGLEINKYQTTAFVRNYDDAQKAVDVKVAGGKSVLAEKQMVIEPRSVEPVVFDTLNGKVELAIMQDDDLAVDNRLYISSPARRIRALLITNSDSSYVMAALKSLLTVDVELAFPPVIKGFDYDVIIIHNVSRELMLPGFYMEINRVVSNGTGLVVMAQDGFGEVASQLGMPLRIGGQGNLSRADVKVVNRLTNGIDFGVVTDYVIASTSVAEGAERGMAVLVSADDGSTLLSVYSHGNGFAAYYGFLDDKATFKSSYIYPVFWDNLLEFLTGTEDIAGFNFETGRIDVVGEQEVATPSGSVTTSSVFFDEAGFYSFGGKTIAANLLSSEESDIRSETAFEVAAEDALLVTSVAQEKGEVALDGKLIAGAILLVLAELLLIKIRGDL